MWTGYHPNVSRRCTLLLQMKCELQESHKSSWSSWGAELIACSKKESRILGKCLMPVMALSSCCIYNTKTNLLVMQYDCFASGGCFHRYSMWGGFDILCSLKFSFPAKCNINSLLYVGLTCPKMAFVLNIHRPFASVSPSGIACCVLLICCVHS